MPKRATKVVLSEKEQEALVQITKRHRSEQQQAQRARIILASAQGDSNAQIARELHINVDTVRLWRDRWVGLQGINLDTLRIAERLQDAPRPGTPPKFTAEQRCQMAALACEAPMKAESGASSSRSRHGMRAICSKRGPATAPLPVLVERGARCAAGREDPRRL